jgi:hypothetical protein
VFVIIDRFDEGGFRGFATHDDLEGWTLSVLLFRAHRFATRAEAEEVIRTFFHGDEGLFVTEAPAPAKSRQLRK